MPKNMQLFSINSVKIRYSS